MHPARPRAVRSYSRVSGIKQGKDGTSIEAQPVEHAAYCRARGWPAPIFYTEVESGSAEKQERRLDLARLIREAEPGDVVLVSAVDRWSRDLVWGVDSVRKLIARGVGWVAIREGIDASTQQGDSTLGIMAWVADGERRRIKDRMVGTRRRLRDEGAWVEGLPPFGYAREPRDAASKGRKLMIVEPAGAAMQMAFKLALEHGLGPMGEQLDAAFPDLGHAWHKHTLNTALRSRVYLGEVQSSTGTWIPDCHPALIEPDLWHRVQAALDARRLGGRRCREDARTASWLLRGLASCGLCGARLGAAYSRGAVGYYTCGGRLRRKTCTASYLSVEATDAAVGALALARLHELRAELGQPVARVAAPVATDYTARRAALAARRVRVLDLAEAGHLDGAELRARLAKVDAEVGRLDVAEAGEARQARAAAPAARREALAETTTLVAVWGRATVAQRRDIVRRLARSIRLASGADPVIEWISAVDLAM